MAHFLQGTTAVVVAVVCVVVGFLLIVYGGADLLRRRHPRGRSNYQVPTPPVILPKEHVDDLKAVGIGILQSVNRAKPVRYGKFEEGAGDPSCDLLAWRPRFWAHFPELAQHLDDWDSRLATSPEIVNFEGRVYRQVGDAGFDQRPWDGEAVIRTVRTWVIRIARGAARSPEVFVAPRAWYQDQRGEESVSYYGGDQTTAVWDFGVIRSADLVQQEQLRRQFEAFMDEVLTWAESRGVISFWHRMGQLRDDIDGQITDLQSKHTFPNRCEQCGG